ncbi:MAG TPA: enoyl-CoA hydratase [Desulfobacteraceae bacterium]|nr:MAG: enoyl-CoA hydratase [Deltaproteobacteria bacterium]HDZ23662.1 enoyl-CoA hydratase [Desulfobacteraceae bacterium]
MELPDIIYSKSNAIASILLDRPDSRNAFTYEMAKSLSKAFDDAQSDPQIKVIILSGRGEAFCSGGNIKDMADGRLASWDMKRFLWDHIQKLTLRMQDIDKPILAAIDGPAHGGGFDLAMTCDLRIASERATFCATYVKIGLAPGNGSAYFLTRCIGVPLALDILLTGRVLNMKEALDLGLVQAVVPPERLLENAVTYANTMARWPLESLRAVKRAVYHGLHSDLRGHLDYMSSQLALLTQTPEHREAVEAFVSKRESKTS